MSKLNLRPANILLGDLIVFKLLLPGIVKGTEKGGRGSSACLCHIVVSWMIYGKEVKRI